MHVLTIVFGISEVVKSHTAYCVCVRELQAYVVLDGRSGRVGRTGIRGSVWLKRGRVDSATACQRRWPGEGRHKEPPQTHARTRHWSKRMGLFSA